MCMSHHHRKKLFSVNTLESFNAQLHRDKSEFCESTVRRMESARMRTYYHDSSSLLFFHSRWKMQKNKTRAAKRDVSGDKFWLRFCRGRENTYDAMERRRFPFSPPHDSCFDVFLSISCHMRPQHESGEMIWHHREYRRAMFNELLLLFLFFLLGCRILANEWMKVVIADGWVARVRFNGCECDSYSGRKAHYEGACAKKSGFERSFFENDLAKWF